MKLSILSFAAFTGSIIASPIVLEARADRDSYTVSEPGSRKQASSAQCGRKHSGSSHCNVGDRQHEYQLRLRRR